MKNPDLKPCPFCGHIAHVSVLKQSVTPRFYVVCSNAKDRCIASDSYVFGRKYPTREDAIYVWNRRAEDES